MIFLFVIFIQFVFKNKFYGKLSVFIPIIQFEKQKRSDGELTTKKSKNPALCYSSWRNGAQ